MIKSKEEIDIIKNGARIADIGGYEIVKNIKEGATELEIAISGRDKMEREIAKTYPNAEYMDTWVWFQSGINTDGAHNPKTNRKLVNGDILSLNTFPMISGYYTALERTLFLNSVDDQSLKAWEANVKVHKRGLELIKPGVKCSDICNELNELFAELGYLQYRTFGYGHSFGVLSHFYGRESGLELREDIDTVLEENMVISMEPMILIPDGIPGAGGYREHDILVIGKIIQKILQSFHLDQNIILLKNKMSKNKVIVNSWNEWDPLKHVIVGRADGTCIPAPEPALDAKVPEDSDMRGQFGPRTKDTVDKANQLLDDFSNMLIKRGIKVDRPTPIDFNQKTSTPDWEAETMFGCMPPRDVLLTVGNEILEATMSYRCRWFEYLCYRPF